MYIDRIHQIGSLLLHFVVLEKQSFWFSTQYDVNSRRRRTDGRVRVESVFPIFAPFRFLLVSCLLATGNCRGGAAGIARKVSAHEYASLVSVGNHAAT